MKLPLLLLVFTASIVAAADKPVVYNHPTKEGAEIEPLVSAAYAPKFKIVDILEDSTYVRPKVKAGSLPRVAKTAEGKPLGGYVLLAFIISMEGRAIEALVLKTTDKRLNDIALKAAEGWRLDPATLNGVPISTTAAQEFTFETAPTEFVTQVLEPTGGKIPRPKDWHYREGHQGSQFQWTLSREDTKKVKHYETGMLIELFSGVKEGAGMNAKQFMLDTLEGRKKKADKVFKTCDGEEEQGPFTRVCLEVEEGPYHVLYSFFWMRHTMDTAVVTIAGAPKELWDTYRETFDKMAAFELIDLERFKK